MSLSDPSRPAPPPRIEPGGAADIGWVSSVIVTVLGRAARTDGPPNLFATLARHRRLFRAWLWFASALMPRGSLPRADTELVILRVAHNCRCDYEWAHHERIAQDAGLTAEQVQAVRAGRSAQGWSARQALLLAAADELHERRDISEDTWGKLAGELRERELIELPMLVGHYEMLAMTLNSLRVQPDRPRRRRRGGSAAAPVPELAGRQALITTELPDDSALPDGAPSAERAR